MGYPYKERVACGAVSYLESKLIPEVSWRLLRRLIGHTSAVSTVSFTDWE